MGYFCIPKTDGKKSDDLKTAIANIELLLKTNTVDENDSYDYLIDFAIGDLQRAKTKGMIDK